jgi:hypothetical protein
VIQSLTEKHDVEPLTGAPAGGLTTGPGISITWATGPEDQAAAQVETVIQAAVNRLMQHQSTRFKCREYSIAITKMEEAIHWLQARSSDRDRRGLQGNAV